MDARPLLLLLACLSCSFTHCYGAGHCPSPDLILPCICANRTADVQIWCTHSDLPRVLDGLKNLGQYIKRPIDELIIENNYLPSLPGKVFQSLQVMRLMLRHNGLERVASGWLASQEKSLIEIYIVEEDLRSLPIESMDHLQKLQAITIQTDMMKRIPNLSGLRNLKYISIQSTSLIELDGRSLSNLPSLEKLYIDGCPMLNKLEQNVLHNLPSLKRVNITNSGVSWIHMRAFSLMPSLVELSLSGNKISDAGMVGRSLRDIPSLASLYLDNNSIDKLIEGSFVDLPSLRELTISQNKIQEIYHGAFHRVPALKIINLNFNFVRRVHPEAFLQQSGSGVEEITLIGNNINQVAELSSILDALPRLKYLDLSENFLEQIPRGTLRGHPTLERLHLNDNRIRIIDREAIVAMPMLMELTLKNNSLSNQVEGPYWNLPNLKGLDLSHNLYHRLEPRLFFNLPSLRKLDCSRNDLVIIDPITFIETPLLEYINISGNALSSLHPATFRNLINLYELDVSRNRLMEFVPGLPRGVEYLHISNNLIPVLPHYPSPDLDLPSLRMLDISGNGLQRMPTGIVKSLPQLRRLHIAKNSMRHIDENSLAGLTRLEFLDISNNKLMALHPNTFKDMLQLKHLDLHGNVLEDLTSDSFKELNQLKFLDLSHNRFKDLPIEALTKTRQLEILNMSSNYLTAMPRSIYGMDKLEVLDVSINHLRGIPSEIISSLGSLRELKMPHNKVVELPEGTFQNMPSLEVLDLENNELQMVYSGAIRTLPQLRVALLARNRLIDIPDAAFAELPSLRVVELQNNRLQSLANHAFYKVPLLQYLNLSNNQIFGLESAGLRSLYSLEVLDISNNKVSRVNSRSFENMEWLVELKMDNNKICTVTGSPFNFMPRLKVLSMRGNKLQTLAESAVKALHTNIAVLDIDGNPLQCDCSLVWLRFWLEEATSMGPHCGDGTLLREMRLSRADCSDDQKRSIAPYTECEHESLPSTFGTSQVFSPWMEKIKEQTYHQNGNKLPSIAPSPEESEYFYDEYIDYPYNETGLLENNNLLGNVSNNSALQLSDSNSSSNRLPGGIPTIYAAANKTQSNEPEQNNSGFTFFGLPIPNLNIGKLWGSSRKSDRKVKQIESTSKYHKPQAQPEFQTGGFVPMFPGMTGGFKPMMETPGTNISIYRHKYDDEQLNINHTSWPEDFPSRISAIPVIRDSEKVETMAVTTSSSTKRTILMENTKKEDKRRVMSINNADTFRNNSEITTNDIRAVSKNDTVNRIVNRMANAEDLSNFEKNMVVNHTDDDLSMVSVIITTDMPSTDDWLTTSMSRIKQNLSSAPTPRTYVFIEKDENLSKVQTNNSQPSALSAFLIPSQETGFFSNQVTPNTARRPATITKVESPYLNNHTSENPILIENFLVSPGNYRTAKTSFNENQNVLTKNNEDSMSWYFTNYNHTNLEPYVGPRSRSHAGKFTSSIACYAIGAIILSRYL